MRTTFVIEDDALEAARSLTEAEGKSVCEVISTRARRGLAPQPQEAIEGGFPRSLEWPTREDLLARLRSRERVEPREPIAAALTETMAARLLCTDRIGASRISKSRGIGAIRFPGKVTAS